MNQIALFSVSADDKIELLEKFGNDNVRFETLPGEETTYGEPVTIAIIGLSAIAVTGLVAYLLKGRKSGRVKVAHMRMDTSNGSIELWDVELEFDEEQEASEQMINALQGWSAAAVPPSQ